MPLVNHPVRKSQKPCFFLFKNKVMPHWFCMSSILYHFLLFSLNKLLSFSKTGLAAKSAANRFSVFFSDK